MRMRLLTEQMIAQLPGYKQGEDQAKFKFFNPAGAGTWWASEAWVQSEEDQPDLKTYCRREGLSAKDLEDRMRANQVQVVCFGAAEIQVFELGDFSLTEICRVQGPYRLYMERDVHFKPIGLEELAERKRRAA